MDKSSTTRLIRVTKLRTMVSNLLGIYETLTILHLVVHTMMTIKMDHPVFIVGKGHGMMTSCKRHVIQDICSSRGSPVVRLFDRSPLPLDEKSIDCERAETT